MKIEIETSIRTRRERLSQNAVNGRIGIFGNQFLSIAPVDVAKTSRLETLV